MDGLIFGLRCIGMSEVKENLVKEGFYQKLQYYRIYNQK